MKTYVVDEQTINQIKEFLEQTPVVSAPKGREMNYTIIQRLKMFICKHFGHRNVFIHEYDRYVVYSCKRCGHLNSGGEQ